MSEFDYTSGTARVRNGETRVYGVGLANWVPANVKDGDQFETADYPPHTISGMPVWDPDWDSGAGGFYIELAFAYSGADDDSIDYKVSRTSAMWGTNYGISIGVAYRLELLGENLLAQDILEGMVDSASAAQDGAVEALDQFSDVYMGPAADPPTLDLDGDALRPGMLYYDTDLDSMRQFNGDLEWEPAFQGIQGDRGNDAGILFTFDNLTTISDPGPGDFRLSSTDHTIATSILIDASGSDGVAYHDSVMGWGSAEGDAKGRLLILNADNRAIYREYRVTAAPVDHTGWVDMDIVYVAGAGTLPPGAECVLIFIPQGDQGVQGEPGVSIGVSLEFDDSTAMTDPGTGKVHFDSATPGAIGFVAINNSDVNATAIYAWIDSFADVANSTVKGVLRFQDPLDPAVWIEFRVTGDPTDEGGFRKIPVIYSSGDVPADGTDLVAGFSPSGADGIDGEDATDAGLYMIYESSTTDSMPSDGGVRGNDGTPTNSTILYISKNNRLGDVIEELLLSMDDSTNPSIKGELYFTRTDDLRQLTFQVTGVTDAAGYVKVAVANGAGYSSLVDADLLSMEFHRAGDVGAAGPGGGDVLWVGGPSVTGNVVMFTDTSGTSISDSGIATSNLLLKDQNLSDLGNVIVAHDNLWVHGTSVASSGTIGLESANGHVLEITGTTGTTAVTLSDGHVRILRANGAWPLTNSGTLVINNNGSNYTTAADDIIIAVQIGSKTHMLVLPKSGTMGASAFIPSSYLDTDTALTANSNAKVPSQAAVKSYVDATYRPGGTTIAVADGGTGGTTQATARSGIGLGSIATQASSAVSITGGTIQGVSTLQVVSTDTGSAINGYLELYRNKASGVANADVLNGVQFNGNNLVSFAKKTYAQIQAVIQSGTASAEYGQLQFGVIAAGTLAMQLVLASGALQPLSSNLISLGTTSLGYSALHMHTGSTLNFSNGNAVLTHSSGILTVSTGDLRVTTAGTNSASVVTVGGTQTLTGKTLTTPSIIFSNTGLQVYDTNASHALTIAPGSDITAARTLTLTTGDASRTITLSGNPTLNDWFDQSVKSGASPTFAGLTISGVTNWTSGNILNIGTTAATARTALGLGSTALYSYAMDQNVNSGSGVTFTGITSAGTNSFYGSGGTTIYNWGGNAAFGLLFFGNSGARYIYMDSNFFEFATIPIKANSGQSLFGSIATSTGISVGSDISATNYTVFGTIFVSNFSSSGASNGKQISGSNIASSRGSGNVVHQEFYNTSGLVGTIKTNGAATTFNTSSDRRLKANDRDFDAVSVLRKINVIEFDWLSQFNPVKDELTGEIGHGVIAQDLFKIWPDAVSPGNPDDEETDNDMWGVDYGKLSILAIKGWQSHDAELIALRARVTELESRQAA